jgi:CelD/BcsL family acetyltransferase involved in cellulose biosynthesis
VARDYTTEILPRDRWLEWDDFVSATPQGTVFHRTAWLMAICGGPERLSLLVCRNAAGALAGGLPLVKRPLACFTSYRLPPLTPYAGMVLNEPESAKIVNQQSEQKDKALALLAAMPKAAMIRFPLALGNTDTQPFRWHGYQSTVVHTYRLVETLSADNAWNGIDPKQRNSIRKAEKDGTIVKSDASIDDLLPLIRLTFAKQDLETPQSEETYRRLWAAAHGMGQGSIYLAVSPAGKSVAGQLVIWDRHCTYLLLSGMDPEQRAAGAGAMMLWQAIRDALARGAAFDFEGSTLPGVERFYRSWGGRLHPIITVEKITSLPLRLMRMWRDHKAAQTMMRMFTAIHHED